MTEPLLEVSISITHANILMSQLVIPLELVRKNTKGGGGELVFLFHLIVSFKFI